MLSDPSSALGAFTQESARVPERDLARHQRVRAAFQDVLRDVTDVLEDQPPERWLPLVYRRLLRAQRNLDTREPEIARFLGRNLERLLEAIRQQAATRPADGSAPLSADEHAQAAQELIHVIEHLLTPARSQERRFTIHRVSLLELLDDPTHFKLGTHEMPSGETMEALFVRAGEGAENPWYPLPLPTSEYIMHKGGTPRVILKILAGAPIERIRAELPPNDFDVIATGDPVLRQREAVRMGVDIEGIEQVESLEDLDLLFAGRDIDLNQCFFGLDGLAYTQQALESARSGSIALDGTERGLYGSETLFFDGHKLAKNRGLQRLLKFVAEGKAASFEFTPLNEQLDFGIYWLALARKFARKKNAGALLDRLFYLGRQIGQVRPGETSIFDVLTRVHETYPFFDMRDLAVDQPALARWLGGKLAKYADRRFRQEERISLGIGLERAPGDDVPYRVSLDGYRPDPERIAAAAADWQAFLRASQDRTEAYRLSDPGRDRQRQHRISNDIAHQSSPPPDRLV